MSLLKPRPIQLIIHPLIRRQLNRHFIIEPVAALYDYTKVTTTPKLRWQCWELWLFTLSRVRENIHLHGLDRLRFSVNKQAHLFRRFAAENFLPAAHAYLRWNIFHKHRFAIKLKDLVD